MNLYTVMIPDPAIKLLIKIYRILFSEYHTKRAVLLRSPYFIWRSVLRAPARLASCGALRAYERGRYCGLDKGVVSVSSPEAVVMQQLLYRSRV